mmetsp:Transcript_6055/g.13437  ORF Transcript_6055/g.13437 Transcript_6055/m.13437 type:complete len:210 (-) Transcript_6055:107-736(-)
MAHSRRSAPLLVLLAAACCCMLAGRSFEAFASAQARRAALLGGVAGAVAAAVPEESARAVKFSVFGFGDGASDAYSQQDNKPYSPYSQFSGGDEKENLYKPYSDLFMNKKRVIVSESAKRLAKLKPSIEAKAGEEVKMELTRQMGALKQAMNYLVEGNSKGKEVNEAFQGDLEQLGVYGKQKKWDEAMETYEKAKKELADFMAVQDIKA